jgi:hypothetical protein
VRSLKLLLFVVLVCAWVTVRAHPLGNSTVNRWAQLSISADGVEIDYVLDLAELPTLVESASADRNGDGEVSAAEWAAHAKRWARGLTRSLRVEADGRPLAFNVREQRWKQQEGEAGLATLRLEARLRTERVARPVAGPMSLTYNDETNSGSLGWKEVLLRASDEVRIVRTTLPRSDRSRRLTAFAAGADAAYPDVTSGSATFELIVAPAPLTPAQAVAAAGNAPESAAAAAGPPAAPVATASSGEAAPAPPADGVLSEHPRPLGLLVSYFRLGMHHIATGWDHLLFLFGLLLLRLELRRIVMVVTAFTLAHSLTLGIAAAGWITPPSIWTEPAIALTIAYVGIINLLRRGGHQGLWLAFGFGLIHGFGFAGALAESAATGALDGKAFLFSLASFNLGIEALQLALVLVVVPVLAWCARRAWYAAARRVAAAGLAASGMGVFIARLAGAMT